MECNEALDWWDWLSEEGRKLFANSYFLSSPTTLTVYQIEYIYEIETSL